GIARALTKPIRQSMLFDTIAALMNGGDAVPAAAVGTTIATDGGIRPPVLVAEDTPINQEVVRAMLERLGYRADVVANGREAIDMMARIPYLAVLMDMQMPEMDGLEATAVIRNRTPPGSARIPIIALTAN